MDNKNELSKNTKSNLILDDRKKMTLTGVLEIISFDEEKIVFNTVLGRLVIKGQGLKMDMIDVKNTDVVIRGYMSSFAYTGKAKIKNKKSFLKKLFKKGE